MKTKAQIKGINGGLFVNTLVNNEWESDWTKIDQDNDDGIDGIIHIRKRGELTGEAIYVQIKAGSGYKHETKSRPDQIGINVGETYLETHKPRWKRLKGAVILVFLDDDMKAYWANLKSESSYTESNKAIILVSKKQRFGGHSKGEFKKFDRFLLQDRELKTVKLTSSDLSYLNINKPLKSSSRKFYNTWSKSDLSERMNPGLGEVLVNRSGWRHISTTKRGYDKIYQSWQLLSAAKQIIKDIGKAYQITKQEKPTENAGEFVLKDFVSLRARVVFPNRQESVVQVILRRKRITNKTNNVTSQQVWFYSVFEPRRGIKLNMQ